MNIKIFTLNMAKFVLTFPIIFIETLFILNPTQCFISLHTLNNYFSIISAFNANRGNMMTWDNLSTMFYPIYLTTEYPPKSKKRRYFKMIVFFFYYKSYNLWICNGLLNFSKWLFPLVTGNGSTFNTDFCYDTRK